MFTDHTYYQQGEFYIPNVKDISAAPVDSPSTKSALEFLIDKYEREHLLDVLGVEMYDQLKSANEDLENADQKWQDLVNGCNYTLDGKHYRWDGLIGYEKNSLLAAYVFCKYLKNDYGTYTTTGIVINKPKNAVIVDPKRKYLTAWGIFINLHQNDCDNNNVRSLWQFLNDSNTLDATSFPNIEDYFKFYKHQNWAGI